MENRAVIGVLAIVVLAGLGWWFFDARQITTGKVLSEQHGEQLAFVSENDIYVLDMETENTTQLTRNEKADAVQWHPDGERISFLYDNNLYLLNVVTGDLKQIRENVTGYSWSPDGTQLAILERANPDSPLKLFVSNSDGSDHRELAENAGAVSWSPDGARLVYAGQYSSEDGGTESDITLIDVDGSNPVRIEADGIQSYSSWSPDGKFLLILDHILHVQGGLTGYSAILYDLATGETSQLEVPVPEGERPIWSQDSQTLLYTEGQDGRICRFSITGGEPECSQGQDQIGWNSAWNSDNMLIAFVQHPDRGSLCVISRDVPRHGASRCVLDWEKPISIIGWRSGN